MELEQKEIKKRKKGRATKDRIHTCAMALFTKYGYDNVTVMQICEAAGVTKRTFYYHFSSKDDILSDVTEYVGIHTEEFLTSLTEQSSNIDILWKLLSAYSVNAEDLGQSIINKLYSEKLQGKETAIFPDEMYLYKTTVRVIRNAQFEHEIHSAAPAEDIAYALFHAFRSISFTWAAGNSTGDLMDNYRSVFHTILGIPADADTKNRLRLFNSPTPQS